MVSDSSSREPAVSSRHGYVVVARRYRPQTFDDLVGQQHVVRGLTRAIQSGRVGHAYLFTGARGVGKTSAARILAKALNCQAGPTCTPCGECDICQSIAAGDDVDVLEIDGASNRGIDEIRQLRQNVAIRPSRARLKIYIIDEVHMLTKDAFNALLKTLEEPPEHVKFIFATTEPNKIPLTILSRCQRFDFAGIGVQAIAEQLRRIAESEGIAAEPEALETLARRGAGSMRDSQSLLEQLMAVGQRSVTVDQVNALLGIAPAARLSKLVHALVAGRAGEAIDQLDDALQGGIDSGLLLDQLLGYFRDIMVAAVGCDHRQFLYTASSQFDEVTRFGKELGVEKVLAILQILQQATARFRTLLDGRTLVELALVRISALDAMDPLPALIAELRSGSGPSDRTVRPSAPAMPQAAAPAKKNDPTGPDRPSPPPSSETRTDPAERGTTPRDTPERGVASEPLTSENAAAVWGQVLDRLAGRAELVADQAALFCRIDVPAPNRLVVHFPAKYTSGKTFCEQPQQRAKLEQAIAAVTGTPVGLQFEQIGDDPEEGSEAPPSTVPSRRQMLAEVGRRPFIRRAMELFETGLPKVEPPRQ